MVLQSGSPINQTPNSPRCCKSSKTKQSDLSLVFSNQLQLPSSRENPQSIQSSPPSPSKFIPFMSKDCPSPQITPLTNLSKKKFTNTLQHTHPVFTPFQTTPTSSTSTSTSTKLKKSTLTFCLLGLSSIFPFLIFQLKKRKPEILFAHNFPV